jgi:tRNA threonylcarbamoyl adenosine modification protein YjeE
MAFHKNFHVEKEAALEKVAADLAPILKKGAIISLNGDLGAGKTALARAIIRFLCQNKTLDVPSPTFTLVQTYETPAGSLWHYDLYRLKHADEIYETGWEDALADQAIILIEWAERLDNLLPANIIHIHIKTNADQSREIEVKI